MENTAAVIEKGWFESISRTLRIDWLEEKMNLSKGKLVEFALFFGLGLLVGYLAKKYAKYLFAFACFIIVLVILQQFNVISIGINWEKLQGLQPASASVQANIFMVYWEWIKAHVGAVLSFSIGFLAGFKIG
jgi:uncharacterized membrane protein (Fun14 family)